MFSESKRRDHCTGCDEVLLGAVPADCRRILEVGCAEGTLGAALKAMAPFREVLGIEREPEIAAQAARRLDAVFVLDVEKQDPPVEPGSLDCILFGDVLEHLLDPEAVLRRYRRFLNRSGVVLCSIPNVQHHSVLTALCKSDFQYTGAGLLDATHVRFFTYSTIIKLLLDSGFAPVLIGAIDIPCPADLLNAAQPLLRYLGLHPERTQRYLSAYQYIVRGTPLRHESGNGETDTRWNGCSKAEAETPLSFVTCVSNEATLEANLLASPCLGPGAPHEVILLRHCRTAADGLNQGLLRAKHSVVVCLHQDVYLPRGWPARFLQKYRKAEQALGQLGVVG